MSDDDDDDDDDEAESQLAEEVDEEEEDLEDDEKEEEDDSILASHSWCGIRAPIIGSASTPLTNLAIATFSVLSIACANADIATRALSLSPPVIA